MSRWANAYSHGTLIQFEFLKQLKLDAEVRQICAEKGWEYGELEGSLHLFQMLLEGDWPPAEFLIVQPGQEVVATHDDKIIGVTPAAS